MADAAHEPGSPPDDPAIESGEPHEPKKPKSKKKKEKKKEPEGEQEEKRGSDKEDKKRDSGSDAELKPTPKRKNSGSEVEPKAAPPKRKPKAGKKPAKLASDKEAEIAFEDPGPEEPDKKSVSIKSERLERSDKKNKKKKKSKKEQQPESSDPGQITDREKSKEPVEATAVQQTEELQQKKKTTEDPPQKKKESSVSKEETLYNDKDGDRKNEDYDPSETVKKGSSGKSSKEKADVPRIPEHLVSTSDGTQQKKKKRTKNDEHRETPTPLTDPTQEHKHVQTPIIADDNLTERIKLDAARKLQQLQPAQQPPTPNSPSSDPPTPRRKTAQNADKNRKGASPEAGKVSSVERKRRDQRPLFTEHSKERRSKTEVSKTEVSARARLMPRRRPPRKDCRRSLWDYAHIWPCHVRVCYLLYWLTAAATTAGTLYVIYHTDVLKDL